MVSTTARPTAGPVLIDWESDDENLTDAFHAAEHNPPGSAQRGHKRPREALEPSAAPEGVAAPANERCATAASTEHIRRRVNILSSPAALSIEGVRQQQQQEQPQQCQPQCIDLLGSSDDEHTDVGSLSARQGGTAQRTMHQAASQITSPVETISIEFVQLYSLAQRTSQPVEYPMQFKIYGSIMGCRGRLNFQDDSGVALERYSLPIEVEDGTLATTAILGHEIMMQFLDMPPSALQLCLQSPSGRDEVTIRMRRQQQYLASYTGVMTLKLMSETALPLVVRLD